MAKLRVFMSSTCYDFGILRSELRPLCSNMGYEPVMSDFSDILYDPRTHTHDSCLKDVPSCDMVVLVIGSRFGGQAVPSAIELFDFSILEKLSTKSDIFEYKDKLSITQLEVLKAVEQSIPVYVFVDEKVMHDHSVYEKNKDKKEIIDAIDFPSIFKRETAKYIFEFINFLGHRVKNNGITTFSRLEDIKLHLVSQWSLLFQRLLSENRLKFIESRRYHDFSERLDDLKAVILASLSTSNLRETARGAIQYRHLVTFMMSFKISNYRELLLSEKTWDEILQGANIVEVRTSTEKNQLRGSLYLILEDSTFYLCGFPKGHWDRLQREWGNFVHLQRETRQAIVEALSEDNEFRRPMLRYVNEPIEEYLSKKENRGACPECGGPVEREGGCSVCHVCGYSECE